MKIYVLGSTSFMHKMVQSKNDLVKLGLDGWIHPDYELFVRGEKKAILDESQQNKLLLKEKMIT